MNTIDTLRTDSNARDDAAETLGGWQGVRDLIRDTLWDLVGDLKGAGSYTDVAEISRRVAHLAESLETADGILDGTHASAIDGRTEISAPARLLPLEGRQVYVGRMLVWTMVTAGPEIAEILEDALETPTVATADYAGGLENGWTP